MIGSISCFKCIHVSCLRFLAGQIILSTARPFSVLCSFPYFCLPFTQFGQCQVAYLSPYQAGILYLWAFFLAALSTQRPLPTHPSRQLRCPISWEIPLNGTLSQPAAPLSRASIKPVPTCIPALPTFLMIPWFMCPPLLEWELLEGKVCVILSLGLYVAGT